MTQIVFELDALDRFAEMLGGTWPVPVLAGIFPLTSHRLALRLHNEVPGIVVPQELQDALLAAWAATLRRSGSPMRRSSSPMRVDAAPGSTWSPRTSGLRACSS